MSSLVLTYQRLNMSLSVEGHFWYSDLSCICHDVIAAAYYCLRWPTITVNTILHGHLAGKFGRLCMYAEQETRFLGLYWLFCSSVSDRIVSQCKRSRLLQGYTVTSPAAG